MNTAHALKAIRYDARKRSKEEPAPRGVNVEARKTWDGLRRGSVDFDSWVGAEIIYRAEHRGDAVDTAFAARQLEYVYTTAVAREFEYLPFADPSNGILPWDTSVPAGAETFVWYLTEASGTATFLATLAGSDDLPSPSIYGAEQHGRCHSFGSQIVVTVQQLRKAAFAGVNIQKDLGVADKQAHAQVLNDVAAWGREDIGIPGFLNNEAVVRVVAAEKSAAGTSTNWSVATPGELIADVLALVNGILEDTHEIYRPDTIALPARYLRILAQTRLSEDGSGGDATSVMSYLDVALKKAGTPIEFRPLEALRASKSQGYLETDAMIAYSRKEEHVALVVPMWYEMQAVQQVGFKLRTPTESMIGGPIFRVPATAAMMTGLGVS
jgi:hypothetical protein